MTLVMYYMYVHVAETKVYIRQMVVAQIRPFCLKYILKRINW